MAEEKFEHSCKERTTDFNANCDATECPVLDKESVDEQIGETLFVKQELDETDSSEIQVDETLPTDEKVSRFDCPETKEESNVGKLKVRSFASLAELKPAPNSPQASYYYGGAEANQEVPLNLTFPHRYNLPPIDRESVTTHVENNSFTGSQKFLRNMGFQLLNNNSLPNRGSLVNSPTIHNTLPLMQFLGQRVVPNMFLQHPTAVTRMPNSYVPLKIPVLPHSRAPPVISGHGANVASASDLPTVPSQMPTPSLEDDGMTSNVTVKEEVKTELDSPGTSKEEDTINSTSTNIIVKDEVDLGVTMGSCGEYNLNDFGTHFLTSDSIAAQVPTTSNVNDSTEIDTHEGESSERSHQLNLLSIPEEFRSRYRDVDPEDLWPVSKPKGQLLCYFCDFRYTSEKGMNKHKERLHSTKYNYRCFLCNQYRPDSLRFPSLTLLEHHVATIHRGERRYKCMKCQSCFKSKSGLKNHHANSCRVDDPYACHLCNFTCLSMYKLQNHLSKLHDDTPEECSICCKMMKKSDMKKHMYAHKGSSNKKCVQCDFSTPSKAKMLSHYNRTYHNRKYRCEMCGWGTNLEGCFTKHNDTCNFSRGKLYVCSAPGCDKKFKNRLNYTHHSRLHNIPGAQVFNCPLEDCEYTVMIHSTLMKHLKHTKHHLPFKCADCTLRFRKEDSMAAHVQKTHLNKIIQKLGYPLPEEEDDLNVDVEVDQEDVEEYEEDPYAHFKKGWLGISCFDEEEKINQSLEPDSSSVPIETHRVDAPEVAHFSPKMSCSVEHGDISNRCTAGGDGLADIEGSSNERTANYKQESATMEVDFTDVSIKVECGDDTTMTPSMDFVQEHVISNEDHKTLNSTHDSGISVDDVTVKSDPDTSENIADYIKSDPEDILDTNPENVVVTPSIDFLHLNYDECTN